MTRSKTKKDYEPVTFDQAWKQTKSIVPNFIIAMLMVAAIIIFKLGGWKIILFVVCFQLMMAAYSYYKNKLFDGWQTATDILKTIIILIIFISMYKVLGNYSFYGVGLFLVILSIYFIWRGRKMVMQTIRNVEATIWNKPLDRKRWKKGEFKNTKVKIVWKK